MISAPVFPANELNPSSLPLSSWIQHGQAYAQQQYEQASNGIPVSQQAQTRSTVIMPSSVSPALQARKPIWMTSAAVIDSLPLGSQDILRSVSPAGSMSPPPPTSTGSPVVSAAMINAAAAHLAASARHGSAFPDNSPFASPHTPLDTFFRPATTIASAESTSAIGTPNNASLFDPSEQRYISDFLNKFTFDSHDLKNDSSLSKPSSKRKNSTSNNNNRSDGAYPSPEPNRPENSLKLLASHSIARSNSLSLASPSNTGISSSGTATPISLSNNCTNNAITTPTFGNSANVKIETLSLASTQDVKNAQLSSTKRKRVTIEVEQRKRSLVDAFVKCNDSPSEHAHLTTTDDENKRVSGIRSEHDNKTSLNSKETNGGGNQSKKELLTEEQKRLNHIRSEQKRRDAIRTGFQDLGEMIPALRGARYSKSVMLDETVAWIAKLEADCQKMQSDINLLEARRTRQRH